MYGVDFAPKATKSFFVDNNLMHVKINFVKICLLILVISVVLSLYSFDCKLFHQQFQSARLSLKKSYYGQELKLKFKGIFLQSLFFLYYPFQTKLQLFAIKLVVSHPEANIFYDRSRIKFDFCINTIVVRIRENLGNLGMWVCFPCL